MKIVSLSKTVTLLFLVMILSTSLYAQEKTKENKAKADTCCPHKENHVCTDDCKTKGCDAVKAKDAKHTCTSECAKIGCSAVKAKSAKSVKTSDKECKTEGCESKKCETDKAAKYECPMKCEPASDKEGKCSECGMELKKV